MYNDKIILDYAQKLYNQANVTVVLYTIGGFITPIIIGIFLGLIFDEAGTGFLLGLLAGIIFAVVGFFLGQSKAFQLKLQAQTALCQMQIELNTRALSKVSESFQEQPSKQAIKLSFSEDQRPAPKNVATSTISYRTCIKCLHQNPKYSKKCERCGYEFTSG